MKIRGLSKRLCAAVQKVLKEHGFASKSLFVCLTKEDEEISGSITIQRAFYYGPEYSGPVTNDEFERPSESDLLALKKKLEKNGGMAS